MRINRRIRARKVRLIDPEGKQLGVFLTEEALKKAQGLNLDLVEVVPTSDPPVCKIIDYGKFRYDQSKREKESKRSQQQVKMKEVKVRPGISEHDLDFKMRNARNFLEKGFKVKLTCMFRGREMANPERGADVLKRVIAGVEDIASQEAPLKRMGRNMHTVVAPRAGKAKKRGDQVSAKDEDKKGA